MEIKPVFIYSRCAVSPTGYINNDLGLEYLDWFDEQTRDKANGKSRILFLDGHGSHHTWHFLIAAEARGIICLGYPPHTTHVLQHMIDFYFDFLPLTIHSS